MNKRNNPVTNINLKTANNKREKKDTCSLLIKT